MARLRRLEVATACMADNRASRRLATSSPVTPCSTSAGATTKGSITTPLAREASHATQPTPTTSPTASSASAPSRTALIRLRNRSFLARPICSSISRD